MSKRWMRINVSMQVEFFCEPFREEAVISALTSGFSIPKDIRDDELIDEVRTYKSAIEISL